MNRLLFLSALVCATAAHAETAYFAAIEDLPMPPGFVEVGSGASFESDGGGRLVLMSAEGELAMLGVRDFYIAALPALGWAESPQPDGALVFQRGREQLSFSVDRAGARTHLDVQLVVRPASMNLD